MLSYLLKGGDMRVEEIGDHCRVVNLFWMYCTLMETSSGLKPSLTKGTVKAGSLNNKGKTAKRITQPFRLSGLNSQPSSFKDMTQAACGKRSYQNQAVSGSVVQ